jgi:uncharacterized protein (DUF1778 family)
MSNQPTIRRPSKTERLDLRVSQDQKRLLEEAASYLDRTVTDFVVQSATVAARDVMADRTQFVLSPEDWAAFSEAIDRAPRYLPRLSALLAEPSVLDKG